MREKKIASKKMNLFGLVAIGSIICLLNPSKANSVEATRVTDSHIGTFNGSTTFTTTSRNGINPGLFLEVMDEDGNLTQYESEEGVITIPETKEGAYVTQAKLLGKTKYVDEDTGEILNQWEEGRNLKLVSSESPGLTTKNKQTFIDFKEVSRGEGDIVVESSSDGREVTITTLRWIPISYMLNYEENQSYTIKFEYEATNEYVFDLYDVNGRNRMSFRSGTGAFSFDFMPESTDGRVIEIQNNLYGGYLKLSNVEFGLTSKKDEPYKTSVVSTSEDLELRGIGNVRDTLDLITGEVVQRVGELTLDSNGNWYWKWNDWEGLNKKQSQDIALALEPIPSEGWLSLNEGPRYVADHSNYALGEIKANSTVGFTFSALHGQSFVEPLSPQYRLTFIFDQK